MTAPTLKLYPSAPLVNRNDYLEERLENKLNNFNSIENNLIYSIYIIEKRQRNGHLLQS